MSNKRLLAAVAACVAIIAGFGKTASAELLHVQPSLPSISYTRISGSPPPYSTTYDASSGILKVVAVPVAYRWTTTLPPVFVTAPASLTIQVHLDQSGKVVPDIAGDGLVVDGNIVAGAESFSGTLLTGRVTAFGFAHSTPAPGALTTIDSFDFRFTPTGGALLQKVNGGAMHDIGVTLMSENSSFQGDFTLSFEGDAKGTVGHIVAPFMGLSRTCSDASSEGQPIQFAGVITNTGSEPLRNITCSDSTDAALCGVPGDLAVGASAVVTGSYVPVASPSTGTITCAGTGAGSMIEVTKSSSATCNIAAVPAMTLAATCTNASAPGQPIEMSAVLSNTGTETLTAISCIDVNGSALSGVPTTLLPAASATISGSYLASVSPSADTVTCTASGGISSSTVSANSSASCMVVTAPAISVVEACADAPAPGQAMMFSALVTNNGNETLTSITCEGSEVIPLTGLPAMLAPGASLRVTGNYLGSASPRSDTITCSGTGSISATTVTDSGSARCSITTAATLSVVASCSDAAAPGLPIHVSVQVTNTGNETLASISCNNDLAAPLEGIPVTLPPGGAASANGSYIPTVSPSTETITCSANGLISGTAVSSSGGASCAVHATPALTITDSCADAAAYGQPIAFSAIVSNAGNETLTTIKCGYAPTATLNGVPLSLAPGDSATVTGSYTPTATPFTGTLTCSAQGVTSGTSISSSGSSTCKIEPSQRCTATIGYWKNWSGMGKGNQANKVVALLPLWLGTPGGAKSLRVGTVEVAVDVLSQSRYGRASNGITKLYSQLLAVKLNVAAGADSSTVSGVIADADRFLALHSYEIWNQLSPEEQALVLWWQAVLDAYNNGTGNGPPPCG